MKGTMVIVGLGLIGGSLALALKGFEDFEIVGVDVSQPTLRYAAEHGVGDRVDEDAAAELPQADVVALALHPQGIVDFLARYRDAFKPGALVWDVCGVKTAILEAAQVLPGTVDFIGCHPMAGTEFSGVEHAFAEMFRDSHFLLVPRDDSRPEHIALLERLAAYIGCKDVCRTTAQAHDALIAYTSQMMHLIAVSVCDDPELFQCRGFEGSSFRGCTRVAALDVGLWTQLFSLNQPALLAAVDRLLDNLQSYRDALASGNRAALAEKLAHSAARITSFNDSPKIFKNSDNGIISREIFTRAGPPRPSTANEMPIFEISSSRIFLVITWSAIGSEVRIRHNVVTLAVARRGASAGSRRATFVTTPPA